MDSSKAADVVFGNRMSPEKDHFQRMMLRGGPSQGSQLVAKKEIISGRENSLNINQQGLFSI